MFTRCTGGEAVRGCDVLANGDDEQHGRGLDGDRRNSSSLHRCLYASSRCQVRQPPCGSPTDKSSNTLTERSTAPTRGIGYAATAVTEVATNCEKRHHTWIQGHSMSSNLSPIERAHATSC